MNVRIYIATATATAIVAVACGDKYSDHSLATQDDVCSLYCNRVMALPCWSNQIDWKQCTETCFKKRLEGPSKKALACLSEIYETYRSCPFVCRDVGGANVPYPYIDEDACPSEVAAQTECFDAPPKCFYCERIEETYRLPYWNCNTVFCFECQSAEGVCYRL